MTIITDEDLIAELRAALAWALDQIEDFAFRVRCALAKTED